ncbi:MAG: helicase-related protein, partial [Salinibacter sp.]
REETWFSRGVALSDVCNETIVDRSLQLLQAKNRRGTEPHQIIAAACSIRHAEQVASLYRARGVEAEFVVSEGMTAEERTDRLRAYERGELDAMVHVGILGEGYDNKNISIAAIFRPFRSVAPYTQFVGRALRALPDSTDTDNLAHVVAHAGLNQDDHWHYFKHETEEAQVLADLDAWARAQDEATGPEREGESSPRSNTDPAEVTREEIEGFDVDAYLPVEGAEADEAQEDLDKMEAALDNLREKGLDVPDADEIKQDIVARNQPLGDEDLPPPPNRPARERHAYRKILNHAVRRAAGTILHRLDLPSDTALVGAVGRGDEANNVEVVIRMLHRRVNAAMDRADKEAEGRNEWPLDALKDAKEHVPDVRDTVLAHLTAETPYGPDTAPDEADADPTDPSASDDTAWDAEEVDWGDPF